MLRSSDAEMLDLNVVPERSLGNDQWEFVLGMPIGQVVQILQKHCRVIKSAEIVYNDKRPLDSDIVINLIENGIKLSFDPLSQRLRRIEVYNMAKVKLKYTSTYFNSPQLQPSLHQIDQSFGATHPGQFDPNLQLFVLSFRGLTFFFPVDQKYETIFNNPGYQQNLTYPSGFSPIVSKMCVHGNFGTADVSPKMPLACYNGNVNLECAEVLTKDGECHGIKFKLIMEEQDHAMSSATHKDVIGKVYFGDSVQKVLTEIGSPSKIFYKLKDKMRIHSSNPKKLSEKRNTDYFYNYFNLGLDILFDGVGHIVKKFILHSNFPGHYNFNIYYKCQFEVPLLSGDSPVITVTPSTTWEEMIGSLNFDPGKPAVLNRASSTNNINPFGSTRCFRVFNMIFEIMSNDYIASVTLYKPISSKT